MFKINYEGNRMILFLFTYKMNNKTQESISKLNLASLKLL